MNTMQTSNEFNAALADFESTKLAASLQDEFRVLPYWEENRRAYLIALSSSYLFNVLSLATLAGLVYWFLVQVLPVPLAVGVTVGAGLLMELAKREFLGALLGAFFQFGKVKYGAGAIVVVLAAMSITGSYFGAKKAIVELAPVAEKTNIDTLQNLANLRGMIAEKNAQIADARKTKYRGTTTNESTKTIKALTAQISPLETALLAAQAKAEKQADSKAQTHTQGITMQADYFAAFNLLCELLFLLCAGWCKFYRYRSYAEMSAIANATGNKGQTPQERGSTIGTVPMPTDLPTQTDKAANAEKRKLKNKLSAYRTKLEKGIGNEQTARKNIESIKAQLKALEGNKAVLI